MRKILAISAAVLFGGLASLGIGIKAAHASPPYYNPIVLGRDAGTCVNDPGNSGTSGDILYTNSCGLQGSQWGPSPSSYGSGWYSIVLKNTAHGQMCMTDNGGGTDGTDLVIQGCNGSASQAWSKFCSSAGVPSVVDAYGQAVDLYQDHDAYGVNVVAWHLYGGVSEEPEAEEWYGPWNTYC